MDFYRNSLIFSRKFSEDTLKNFSKHILEVLYLFFCSQNSQNDFFKIFFSYFPMIPPKYPLLRLLPSENKDQYSSIEFSNNQKASTVILFKLPSANFLKELFCTSFRIPLKICKDFFRNSSLKLSCTPPKILPRVYPGI